MLRTQATYAERLDRAVFSWIGKSKQADCISSTICRDMNLCAGEAKNSLAHRLHLTN